MDAFGGRGNYKNERRAEKMQEINQTWIANPELDEQVYL